MNNFPYPINKRVRIANFFRKKLMHKQIEKVLINAYQKFPIAKKFIPPEYLYPPGSYRVVVRDGITYRLDLSDVIGHSLYFFNRYFIPDQFVSLIEGDWVIL